MRIVRVYKSNLCRNEGKPNLVWMFRPYVLQPNRGCQLVSPRDTSLHKPKSQTAVRAARAPSDNPSRNVELAIEQGERNSRCVYAGIDVYAPKSVLRSCALDQIV